MRKRIRQIARGKFEYAKPILTFSEELIELQVDEGEDKEGDFVISTQNHFALKGVVYSTNSRMECLTSQFEGEEIRIRFQFHSKGLVEGDKSEGSFVIVCNQCEYSLSFSAIICRQYPESSIGTIHNLYDFSNLARENWTEAYQLFYNKSFRNIINPKEIKESMIYHGIIAARPSEQNMEEFLIGIRKKEPVHISIDKTELKFFEVEEARSEIITIKKSSWGYLELEAYSDPEFLILSSSRITLDDFIGSTYNLEYIIDPNAMHGGRNYGRIYIKSTYATMTVSITASCEPELEEVMESVHLQIEECKVGIMELYQAYRLKRIVTGVWANETIDILNHLHALVPDEPMYVLMKAQAFIINRQRQEAEWILSDFKREWSDHKAPVWGYYLYLMSLMEREPSYVDKMTREIELIFHENPDSVLLFWVLSFLREQYFNNNARKLKAIEYWVMKGCSSPYLYLEAYYLIWQDPYLLTKLGGFEKRVIRWAIRHKAITKDIAEQIFQIVEMSRTFDPAVFKILCAAYDANPNPEYIGLICSYLIRGSQYDTRYHDWFEKGIQLELRITGLYEAYLLSLDDRRIVPVPRIIQMYFQYESSLPYRKMAVLYNNIIAAKDTSPEVYLQYRRTMGKFAMEQVEKRHMDDNLAVLYSEMLDLGLVNTDIAHALAEIVFTNKLVVFDSSMVRAIIYQKQMKDPQIVPIVEQAAYFQLYSKDYVILFEDEKGRRYVGSVSYRLQKLMESEKYITKCMELAPNEISYIISSFQSKQSYLTFKPEDKQYFERIVFGQETSPEYKALILPEILRFYQTQEYDGMIEKYLEYTDFSTLTKESRQYLTDMLIWNRMYDKAIEIVAEYGIDQIGSASKVSLVSNYIDFDNLVEDDFLIKLCESAFVSGKYNDKILSYLTMFYNGPTELMRSIWKSAHDFEIDTFELEERILVQMIYSDAFLPEAEQIFESYYEKGGRELVVLAYLTYCAQGYFVKGETVDDLIFRVIEARYTCGMELNDACKLALLEYISEMSQRTEAQFRIEDELLAEYTCRNMNFAFYKKLDRELVLKYHLYDKVFLEYRTSPQKHVVLHYCSEEDGDDFITEDMPDVYYGIFVKQFIMFFGEVTQYYITEEYSNQVEVTESNRISNNDVYSEKDESRYDLLNQMLISTTLQDNSSLYYNMKKYSGFNEVTKKVFKIL